MYFATFNAFLVAALWFVSVDAGGPFLKTVSESEHIIGNDLWNITIGRQYGTKLYYKDHDLVGETTGHYVSYNGAESDLNWTSVRVHRETDEFLDISFTAVEGDFHWVIYHDFAGAYQYFINHALPALGEFRTLFRLDNETFPNGRTEVKDEPLPALAEILNSTKVQDETWQRADGTYITKYDWATFIRNTDFYGVYGDDFGSWYIVPGKDDYNGNHLKQELMVHRESQTGDAVQLNMIHGTHYQAASNDTFADGRTWGPWLWYLNDGSKEDAASRTQTETAAWPYSWFDNAAYQARGSLRGNLILSDGRPGSHACVFLGDENSNSSTLDMGAGHYYTAYADENGAFELQNVRAGAYSLHAWSNGSSIADVTTSVYEPSVIIEAGEENEYDELTWQTQGRTNIFQIGDFDRTTLGFKYAGSPLQHALTANCPANFTYTVGESQTSDWCYAQSANGTWAVEFELDEPNLQKETPSVLSISLAGYSEGVTIAIELNGNSSQLGTLGDFSNDKSIYRSANVAGEWDFFEYTIAPDTFHLGWNSISFTVIETAQWRGFMWDSIILEYAG